MYCKYILRQQRGGWDGYVIAEVCWQGGWVGVAKCWREQKSIWTRTKHFVSSCPQQFERSKIILYLLTRHKSQNRGFRPFLYITFLTYPILLFRMSHRIRNENQGVALKIRNSAIDLYIFLYTSWFLNSVSKTSIGMCNY
jgi:hypothetical protein